MSYEPEFSSPLSQFIDSDEQPSKSSLSDTELSLPEGFLDSDSQVEHLHSLNSTRIFERANLVPPSPCLNQENARPVQSENDIPLVEGAIERSSFFEVGRLFGEIRPRVSTTSSFELPSVCPTASERSLFLESASDKVIARYQLAALVVRLEEFLVS